MHSFIPVRFYKPGHRFIVSFFSLLALCDQFLVFGTLQEEVLGHLIIETLLLNRSRVVAIQLIFLRGLFAQLRLNFLQVLFDSLNDLLERLQEFLPGVNNTYKSVCLKQEKKKTTEQKIKPYLFSLELIAALWLVSIEFKIDTSFSKNLLVSFNTL